MKRVTWLSGLSATGLALFLHGSALSGQPIWTPIGWPYSNSLVTDPGDPAGIYVLTSPGVVRYNQLTQTSNVLPGSQNVEILAVSPSNPQILYSAAAVVPAPAPATMLLKSSDRGQTWTDLSSRLPSFLAGFATAVGGLVVDPNDSTVFYALLLETLPPPLGAGYEGLFRSADGGNTWQQVRPPDGPDVPLLALSAGNPATLFLLSSHVFSRSSDAGVTWTVGGYPPLMGLGSLFFQVLADPHTPSTVYAAGNSGLSRSVDSGNTWLSIGPFDPHSINGYAVQALAVDPTNPSTLLAATYTLGVQRTTDGGAHWVAFNSGLQCGGECFVANAVAFTNASPSVAFLSYPSALAGAGLVYRTGLAPAGGCVLSNTVLCAGYGRFSASVEWTSGGAPAPGNTVVITPNSAGFWFFSPDNVDLVVKVLDGRDVNGHFWVFYGSLTNVEFTLTVTDTQTGAQKTYTNAQGQVTSGADTSAF